MQCTDLLVRTSEDGKSRRFFVISSEDDGTISESEFEELLRTVNLTPAKALSLLWEFRASDGACVLADIDAFDLEVRRVDDEGYCRCVLGEILIPVYECFGIPKIGGSLDKYHNVFEVYAHTDIELLMKLGYTPEVEFVKLPTRFSMSGVYEFDVVPFLVNECEELYLVLWQYLLGTALHAKSNQNHHLVAQKLAHMLESRKTGVSHEKGGAPMPRVRGLNMWEAEARKIRLGRYVERIEKQREILVGTDQGSKLLDDYLEWIITELDLALELWVYYSWRDLYVEDQELERIADVLFSLLWKLEQEDYDAGEDIDAFE